MSKKIVVVGSLNVDLVTNVAQMPQVGETITGLNFATFTGGKGGNQAVAAAKLGGDVSFVGRVGKDEFAELLLNAMRAANVNIDRIAREACASGTAVILVDSAGNNAIVVTPGANACLSPLDLDREIALIRSAGIVLTQLETPLDTVERLAEITCDLRLPLILDPAPAQRLSDELLRKVSWLTPNESEARALLKSLGHLVGEAVTEQSAGETADLLLNTGVRNIVLKLGERGVYLAGEDVERGFISAFQVEAVDSTAAGDAFNGAFAYGLMQRMKPSEAARFACAAAAVSVMRNGAQSSMPSLEDVMQLLQP